ncbi:unnamed protein product [Eruca vesicaria subsp. sativa]|uniref:Uncharacterized protein n=1 Tax=Eruca vesicaria subsp. sativa TaxID=29727 RepID=A0ABC8KXM5_ERUVS|nr:unnamed protein product [Eruca vesicaria subsp. sativa]
MARLATDGKLRASEIYGVADNVNGTAARWLHVLFLRMSPVILIFLAVNDLELIGEDEQFL